MVDKAPNPSIIQMNPNIEPGPIKYDGSVNSADIRLSTNPTVTVIACGGCGINLLRGSLNDIVDVGATARIIDTSISNIDEKICDTHIIAGDGSGMVRKTHIPAISKYISSQAFSETPPADINIIICSLSGGTGSVVAPMLIEEIKRRGKVAIVICVADACGQLDTNNTYKTLLTFENMSLVNNIYLPIMLFDNKHTRVKVDKIVQYRLKQLLWFLRSRVSGIDKSDRINFFKPDVSVGVQPGVVGLSISVPSGDNTDTVGEVIETSEDHIYDGIFIISNTHNRPNLGSSRILYHGTVFGETANTLVCKIGYPISPAFIDGVNTVLHKYESQDNARQLINFTSTSTINNKCGIIV